MMMGVIMTTKKFCLQKVSNRRHKDKRLELTQIQFEEIPMKRQDLRHMDPKDAVDRCAEDEHVEEEKCNGG
jgi:hypothetical protein